MSVRRVSIDYKDESKLPEIKFEGMWSRKTLDMMYLAVVRAWKVRKMELLREANIARAKQEEKAKKVEDKAKRVVVDNDPISDYLKEGKK